LGYVRYTKLAISQFLSSQKYRHIVSYRIVSSRSAEKARDTTLDDEKYDSSHIRDDEDRVPLRSLSLTQYWSVTDGQTDGFAVTYSACKAMLCGAL